MSSELHAIGFAILIGRLIYARITRCLQNFVEEKSNGKNAHSFGYATR
jgi:hypothetical protein